MKKILLSILIITATLFAGTTIYFEGSIHNTLVRGLLIIGAVGILLFSLVALALYNSDKQICDYCVYDKYTDIDDKEDTKIKIFMNYDTPISKTSKKRILDNLSSISLPDNDLEESQPLYDITTSYESRNVEMIRIK